MTTSTKRSDGGELNALADEIESSEGLLRIVPGQGTVQLGIKKTAQVIAALRTPTNESPAPQAEQSPSSPFLAREIEEKARLMMTGQVSYLGHIVKCAEILRERLAAPQPPVEGLREALRAKINEVNILVREYDTSNPDWAFRSGVMLNVLTKMCRDLDALASPSLTAGENTKSDGGNAPFAYAWEEMVDPTGEVINGKTVTRFATHWSTPPANADVKKLYLHPSDPSPTAPAPDAREAIARNFIAIMQRHLRIERSDGGYIVGWSEAADALSQQPVAVADREVLELIAANDGNADQAAAKRALELINDLALLHPQPAKGER